MLRDFFVREIAVLAEDECDSEVRNGEKSFLNLIVRCDRFLESGARGYVEDVFNWDIPAATDDAERCVRGYPVDRPLNRKGLPPQGLESCNVRPPFPAWGEPINARANGLDRPVAFTLYEFGPRKL